MELIFRAKHSPLNDDFREYASQRLERLARYFPPIGQATVDVRRESKGEEGRYIVQVTVSANGVFLRAEERSFELKAALDSTAESLARQVKRFKEKKLYRSERRVSKEDRFPPPPSEETTDEDFVPPDADIISGHVVRVKNFPMKPMSEAEAIDQMEMLSHNFFLFQDADRGTLAVLYRRRDGNYGLILPDNL